MGQATLDDDLFNEAVDDINGMIESALDDAEGALPSADAVWNPPGDNLLGRLNTLRSALDAEEAREHLREARKWVAVAERTEAMTLDDAVEDRLAAVAAAITALEDAREATGELTGTLPELRQHLPED
ncbi:MAG: DUF5790 family protein [Halobacteriales archaeon]